MSQNPPTKVPFTEKLRMLRDHLADGLVERDVAIRLALLAALSGEHLLLIGPPGTAKSMVARRLHEAFESTSYFERLLTRFSVPEELFGPLSVKQLEQDRYVRMTEGYLPTAAIAFLDEIFKANSAILNALLTLLNERQFDNGTERTKVPLVTVVAASNELPEGEELHALYDRFLLRLHVGPLSDAGFTTLLGLDDSARKSVPAVLRITEHDLQAMRELAAMISVPPEVIELLKRLRAFATKEGISITDRRWRKIVSLLKASAATCGRDSANVWDG